MWLEVFIRGKIWRGGLAVQGRSLRSWWKHLRSDGHNHEACSCKRVDVMVRSVQEMARESILMTRAPRPESFHYCVYFLSVGPLGSVFEIEV